MNTAMQNVIKKVDVSEVVNGIDELNKWGNFAAQAGIIPSGTTIPQAMAIIQTGKEIGLQPMQSLRSMNFIKGRLTMSVQLQLALAKQRGVKIVEMVEEENHCRITLERSGETITCSYSLEDAKKAGLIKQDGNYEKYLKQMLRWRATGDCLRMIAPDLVMGLLSPEEAESIEPFIPALAPVIKETKAMPSPSKKQAPTPTTKEEPVIGYPEYHLKSSETPGRQELPVSGGAIGMVIGIRKETKTNRTTKKEFIVYHIKLDNNIEYTASGKDAESTMNFANDARKNGLKVTIKTKGDKYNTITGIDTIEPDFSDPPLPEEDIDDSEIPF